MNSIIVKTFGRALAPFILIYGVFLTLFGASSPGGGFQGGVVMASAVILVLITHGKEYVQRLSANIEWFDTLGAFMFLIVGIFGILLGGSFLVNLTPDERTMLLILDIVIALKVFAGLVVLFIYLFGLGVTES